MYNYTFIGNVTPTITDGGGASDNNIAVGNRTSGTITMSGVSITANNLTGVAF